MARARFKIDGLKEAKVKIKEISEETVKEIARVVFRSAQNIETRAKKLAPADTGNLRGRIETEIKDKGFTADVVANAEYSAYVEFGTRSHFPPPGALTGWARRHNMGGREFLIARAISRRGTKAQPFMIPAFESEKDDFVKEMRQVLKNLEKR